ncbi:MAG: hypothetical protein Q8942_18480 [Bacillota bacterium]|nr:hypothetical protein [Bacillota bacterium]
MKDINLLPDDIRAPQEQLKPEKSGTSSVKIVTIIIAILALVGVSLILPKVYIITQSTRLDLTNKSIESSKYDEVKSVNSKIIEKASEIKVKNDVIMNIEKNYTSVSQILRMIGSSAPTGCNFDKIDFSEGTLNIQGKVPDASQASSFLSYLSRIDNLKVDSTKISTKDSSTQFDFSFILNGKDGK